MFCIDTESTNERLVDSDSDCEVPKFNLSAFQKFSVGKKEVQTSDRAGTFYHNKRISLSSKLNAGERYNQSNYINFDSDKITIKDQIKRQKELTKKELKETLKKSIVCQPGFEKLDQVPTFLSRRQLQKQNAKERVKTKGFQWFNMSAPEMTEEKKNDLLVIQMRQALDPKHFYKRSANKTNPKYFQVGTYVETPIDFYSSRVPKKQRKQTLVEELMADADFREYQKKKYSDIQKSQPTKFVRRKKVPHRQKKEAKVGATKKVKKNKKQ